ncbi:hypothetical protein BJ170DRAFT_597609 [Xylariales sp. AK1849]|nr:hypothetical protein BJ170DRAFT_597609 [Xylariales sp. AK1849]
MASTTNLPVLLFAAGPADGHINPLLRVASDLIQKGYHVLFLSSPGFKDQVTRAGAEWFDFVDYDLSKSTPADIAALNPKMPIQVIVHALDNIFLNSLPTRTGQLREALEMLHRRDSERQVIVIHEMGSMAVHPYFFGAPLPEGYKVFPKTICLGINPIMFDSVATGFFGAGLPFEDTPAVRARNAYIYDLVHTFVYKQLADSHEMKLKDIGCTSWPDRFRFDDLCLTSDAFLQLSGPSFEYPDPARDPKVTFAGTLPPKTLDPNLAYPTWWPDITGAASEGKKVVFLAQGTLPTPYERLLIPAIRSLETLKNIIVVVALGERGGKLPDNYIVPSNSRVIDYFPYDAVLPYADVFVFNAGYGGASHAIAGGVPMVILGGSKSQDKADVSARIEWSGLGITLKTETPTGEETRDAVRTVLDEPRYKERAVALQRESQELDCLSKIRRQVEEFTR